MKFRHLIQMLFILVLSACAFGPVATPTSTSSVPDLVVSNVYLGMQGVPTNWTDCILTYGPFEIRAMIQNLGQAPAYNISVIELSSGTNLTIGELGAGQGMELYFPITSANATYNVVVDQQNTIAESNERNNTLSYLAITPTPPALCTPISAPSSNLATPIHSNGSESAILSQSVLLNSTYRSPDWYEFQLRDGVYYHTPSSSQKSSESYTTRFQGPVYYGDIDADGLEDALIVLKTQNGGSAPLLLNTSLPDFLRFASAIEILSRTYSRSTVNLLKGEERTRSNWLKLVCSDLSLSPFNRWNAFTPSNPWRKERDGFCRKWKCNMKNDDEVENISALVEDAKDNPIAFGRLYDICVQPVYRYLYSRVGTTHDAEDLTSQTFMSAFEYVPRYRENGQFPAWLFRIARSKMMDHFRGNRYEVEVDVAEKFGSGGDALIQVIQDEEIVQLCRDMYPKGDVKVTIWELSVLKENAWQAEWKP